MDKQTKPADATTGATAATAAIADDKAIPIKPDATPAPVEPAPALAPVSSPAAARTPALGERVMLAGPYGRVPATITRVRSDRMVDLEFVNRQGQVQQITSSPRDDTGTKHDSFHFAD